MGLQERCHINIKLLPFKFHFFFAFGGFAGVMPFMPLIAKQLGINATAVGVGYSIIPIFIFLSNPLFGFLVDYFQNIKIFLIFLLIGGAISFISVSFLPPIIPEEKAFIRIAHLDEIEPLVNLSMPFKRTCLDEFLENDVNCYLVLKDNENFCQENKNISSDVTNSVNVVYNKTLSEIMNQVPNDRFWVTFYISKTTLFDAKCKVNSSAAFQCIPTIRQCLFHDDEKFVFSTYQYWIFVILAILGGVNYLSAATLSSTACYEALGSQVEAYGRQRLFGTIGWGITCPLAGLLNDLSKMPEKSFSAGFYLMGIFVCIDAIILYFINLPKANFSSGMCKDLAKIISSKKILIFAFGVVCTGILNSTISMYEFWYLQDMGASKTLLGLTVAMQCLAGEVPFLFFSGWFVKKLGHFLCFVTVFAGFALRLAFYSLLKNPWFVLPVDVLQGVTFGIYHGAMTSFAKAKAPPGLEATLQGIFGGLYDGLGYGIGSVIAGVGLDYLGARQTFFSASMFSFGCLIIFAIASYFFRPSSMKIMKIRKPLVAPLAAEDSL